MAVSKLLVNTFFDAFIPSSLVSVNTNKYLYRNSASQMFAKQSSSFLSHLYIYFVFSKCSHIINDSIIVSVIVSILTNLCLSWDCQAKAALDSTFLLIADNQDVITDNRG